jgi:hypothetical protein
LNGLVLLTASLSFFACPVFRMLLAFIRSLCLSISPPFADACTVSEGDFQYSDIRHLPAETIFSNIKARCAKELFLLQVLLSFFSVTDRNQCFIFCFSSHCHFCPGVRSLGPLLSPL